MNRQSGFRPLWMSVLALAALGTAAWGAALCTAAWGADSRPASAPGATATSNRLDDLKVPGATIKVYVAWPTAGGPYPGVVMAHEWWGLNPQIKGVADRLAAEGFVVAVPDLYHGFVTDDPEKAHELMRGLTDERGVADLSAAAGYLARQPQATGKPIGIMGFCMGGRLALLTAASGAPLKACAMFYGPPTVEPAQLKKVACPVVGFFGADDQGIPAEAVQNFEATLKKDGKSIETKIYPNAGHAFFNETRSSYREGAARDAWGRLIPFLKTNLGR